MNPARLSILAALLAAAMPLHAQNAQRHFLGFTLNANVLEIATSDGRYLVRPYSANIVETSFIPNGESWDPASHAVVLAPGVVPANVKEDASHVELATAGITVSVDKEPFRISYAYKGRALVAEKLGYTQADGLEALEFALDGDEALYGAGARAVGMNRRGHRFKLYNRADYGYGKTSELLNFTVPMALSSKMYALHFDNPQTGYLDFDSRKDGTLRYEVAGGRKTYQVVAGDSWADIMAAYTSLTGRQPLPPRWALGNFASRFGYKSEAETRAVVDKFIAQKIPLDAVVLDLYWFGKDVKGTMGNLDWDRDTFPHAEKMMADLKGKGVKTILITEPFVLTTSKRWQEAVEHKVLASGADGQPATFDFFFGNTGLIDLYKPEGRAWFWDIYKSLKAGGAGGWWGDLGEPEVHPSSVRHQGALADQVHNVYGHDWARLIAEGYRKDFPNERPFILMRAGYSGSQRFGLIPWSGDVGRSWGGLQSQMEIALQMGMQGLAWMHSDLGGFAGPVLDDELYVRWLQYGVFQPVFRPHAQSDVAPEPVFRDEPARSLAREAVRLRYAMLPYNYTLAFDNSQTGLPLMRPLLFEEPGANTRAISSTYLWGPDFLVAPVVEAGATRKGVVFPVKDSTWFDFYSDKPHRGGITEVVATVPEHIPVFVRAGAFVPMAKVVQSTRDYSTRSIDLHYYHDASIATASGMLYDDDGETAQAFEAGKYEIVHFASRAAQGSLRISLDTETGSQATALARTFTLKVHNVAARPRAASVGGRRVPFTWNAGRRLLDIVVPLQPRQSAAVTIVL
jgi:alpha-glucosidase/oligosaccharide 4-alpha-D-glucosyltransferase